MHRLSKRHQRTLKAIFQTPLRSDVPWDDIVKLREALGAELSAGKGSRIRIAWRGVRAIFHRPHPRKETDQGALKSMRRLLTEAGIKPC